MEENDELFDISETLALRKAAPWFGSAYDMKEYGKVASECYKFVESSTNVREIVLETWLILDYFIRMMLSNLWAFDEYNNEEKDFDLRYELLPGFESCIRLLEKILTIQRSLNEDPYTHSIKLPIKFFAFLRRDYPAFLQEFLALEEAYYQKYYPSLSKQKKEEALFSTKPVSILQRQRYCVNTSWVNALSDLDEEWFKLARRLNKARNKAAHSHDSVSISKAFGYSGSNATERVKTECLDLINELVGLVKMPEAKDAK